jgi:hypothetical protein
MSMHTRPVRVEGVDVEPAAATRTSYGMACRTYPANPHDSGMPARDLIVRALRSARPDERPAVPGLGQKQ